MSGVPIALVAAVARNGVIGAQGGLPWRIKADLRRFRALTMGKPIVMGRRTFDSIGRVLDGRDNIVLSRRAASASEGAFAARSIEEAFGLADARARERGAGEICVVGGGEVYAEAMGLASRLYVTHVQAEPAGDAFFPKIGAEWRELEHGDLPFSEGDTASAAWSVYERWH